MRAEFDLTSYLVTRKERIDAALREILSAYPAEIHEAARMGDLSQKLTGRPAPVNSEKLRKLSRSAWFDGCDIQRELGYEPVHDLDSWLGRLG